MILFNFMIGDFKVSAEFLGFIFSICVGDGLVFFISFYAYDEIKWIYYKYFKKSNQT